MIEEKEKFELGIKDWDYYVDSVINADLFIGNGFSINLCKRLSYISLFENFSNQCNPKLVQLFEKLKTSNFETVLKALNNAEIIAKIFNLNYEELIPTILELKKGLIKTISETHPEYKEINPEIFRSLAVEFAHFNDIYTTNYDIFLYKIILASNELVERGLLNAKIYQDEFFVELGEHRLGLGEAYDDSRVIYYLHGALFLYNEGQTYKFRKGGETDEYIRMLRNEIENDNIPLFVAEGSFEDKLNTINDNYYLRRCLEILKRKNKDNIVVYGSSFQSSDNHIINCIVESKPKNLIVSIYLGNKDKAEIEQEISRTNGLFSNISVSYYDSKTLFNFSSQYVF